MSAPPDARRGLAALAMAVALLVAVAALPVAADGSPAAAGNAGVVDDGPASAQVEANGSAEANDTRTVVVRLDEASVSPSMTREAVLRELKSHAERTQRPLVAFARNHTGVAVASRFWITNAVVLRYDTDLVSPAGIRSVDHVERLHPNYEITLPEPPRTNDTRRSDRPDEAGPDQISATYGLNQVNAPATWETFGTRGGGAKVAVLDTGVDASHPDIDLGTDDPSDPTFPGGWAEFDADGLQVPGSVPTDPDGHGTHVSGTVAGGNDSGQHIGVAPDATLLHGQVFTVDETGAVTSTFAQALGGIQWAVQQDADVVSMSFGTAAPVPLYIVPIRNTVAAGTVPVAAIGNTGLETSGSPANVYEAVGVGATDVDENVAAFSGGELIVTPFDWGPGAPPEWPTTYVVPDVSGPGVAVLSASNEGGYELQSGTSMATPHVSGVVALMVSAAPGDPSVQEITDALYATTNKPPTAPPEQDSRYGRGIVDALEATRQLATPDCIPGDANRDGTVTALDATLVQRALVELPIDGPFDAECADSSGDARLTALDVTLILRTVAGLPVSAAADTATNATTGAGTDDASPRVRHPPSVVRPYP